MTKDSQEKTVLVHHYSSKGKGVSYFERAAPLPPGRAEIPAVIVGEEIRANIMHKKRGQYFGGLLEVLKPSNDRVIPRCIHFPECGGCTWQHLDYSAQLKEKETMVRNAFNEVLKKQHPHFHPIIPAPSIWDYRNKMEFSFSQNKAQDKFLGLMKSQTHHVLNTQRCHLSSEWTARVLEKARSFWDKSGLRAYHPYADEGHLRTLTVRESKRSHSKLIMLTVSGNPAFALNKQQIQLFRESMKATVPEEQWPHLSVFLRIQQAIKGQETQFYEMHLAGPDHLTEQLQIDTGNGMKTLTFKISPTSFFQPNPLQAELLFSKAIQFLKDLEQATVLDLYCGTATLSLAVALKAKKVIGIELNPHAVFDAQWNQECNQIKNFDIKQGDVGQILSSLKEKVDVVLLDPPRAGLDELALQHILALAPSQVLYVSCNPTTQAKNILDMVQAGYQLLEIQPIDQFPHTTHIENIALLVKA